MTGKYGTHSMRRTKASLVYRRTKKLRAVQLLLDHTKLESTVRYLGIEVEDALEMAEQTKPDWFLAPCLRGASQVQNAAIRSRSRRSALGMPNPTSPVAASAW